VIVAIGGKTPGVVLVPVRCLIFPALFTRTVSLAADRPLWYSNAGAGGIVIICSNDVTISEEQLLLAAFQMPSKEQMRNSAAAVFAKQ
jgi:hypothetical protein